MLASVLVVPAVAAAPEGVAYLDAIAVSEPLDYVTSPDGMNLPLVTFVFKDKAETGLETAWGLRLKKTGVTHDSNGTVLVNGNSVSAGFEGWAEHLNEEDAAKIGWRKLANGDVLATFLFPFTKEEINAAGYSDFYTAVLCGGFLGFVREYSEEQARDEMLGDVYAPETVDGFDAAALKLTTENQYYSGYTAESAVYFGKGSGAGAYLIGMSLNGNNVPAEYMAEGYTFEYDVKLTGAYTQLGIAYLDDGDIWGTQPWNGANYFEQIDYSAVANNEWYHVVTPTINNSDVANITATKILFAANGAGTNQVAYFNNFCVKNANGEIVWELDLSDAGAFDTLNPMGHVGFTTGFYAEEIAPEVPVESIPLATEAPATSEPESEEPVPSDPESEEPVPSDPESEEPVPSEPESEEPESSDPESEEPVPSDPESEEPESSEPESEEPESSEPEVTEPEVTEPEDNADALVGDYFYNGEDKVGNYYGLVQFEGNYYYVGDHGKIVKNKVHYVLNNNGYDVAPGNYWFNENGVLEILNGLVGGCYYLEDGTKAPSYYGLVTDAEGNYYYIGNDGKIVTSKVHYVWTTNGLTWDGETAVAGGWYEFDENGMLVNPGIRNGLVGDFYYVDDVKQPSYTGLVEIDGAYYYVADNGKIVKGKAHYVLRTNDLMDAGWYEFGATGAMVIAE